METETPPKLAATKVKTPKTFYGAAAGSRTTPVLPKTPVSGFSSFSPVPNPLFSSSLLFSLPFLLPFPLVSLPLPSGAH